MILIYLVIGYLFGMIPVEYLICKSQGIDIYKEGSGNPGSTNVTRVLGKKWGTLAFILDIVKTIIPIIICLTLFYFDNSPLKEFISDEALNHYYNNLALLRAEIILYTGLGSVLGHIFPITMKFKGGKGVACTFAVILMFSPIYGIVLFLIQKLIAKVFHIVSLASVIALVLLLVSSIVLSILKLYPFDYNNSINMCIPIAIMSITCIIKHKSNIERLLTNTENKL